MAPIIVARDLALRSHRGPVYGPVNLEIGHGVSVLEGPVGSGRTSLLLTLGGRMRPSSGALTALGQPLPQRARAVQKMTGIAGFSTIDDLDDVLTVGAVIRERRSWLGPWFVWVSHPSQEIVDHVLRPVFGEERIEPARRVWSLDEVQKLKLKIALALMAHPKLLFIDSIEQLQSDQSRAEIWRALSELAIQGIDSVVAAASDDSRLWDELTVVPELFHIATPVPA